MTQTQKPLRECSECGKETRWITKGMCKTCYDAQRPLRECKECGKETRLPCKGLCKPCYDAQRPLRECKECGKGTRRPRKGMCEPCYRAQISLCECSECGKETRSPCKGMCNTCYDAQRPLRECKECGEETRSPCKGLCKPCYRAQRGRDLCTSCGEVAYLIGGKSSNSRMCPPCFALAHPGRVVGVYVVRHGRLVKVGKTSDLKDRLVSHRGSSPVPLELERFKPLKYTGLESEMHRALAAFHSHGEWFHAYPAAEAIIAKAIPLADEDELLAAADQRRAFAKAQKKKKKRKKDTKAKGARRAKRPRKAPAPVRQIGMFEAVEA